MKDIHEAQAVTDINEKASEVFKSNQYGFKVISVDQGNIFDYGEEYGVIVTVNVDLKGKGDAYGLQKRANLLTDMTEKMKEYVASEFGDVNFAVAIKIEADQPDQKASTVVDVEKESPGYQFHQSTCKANDEVRFHAGEKPLVIINPHVFASVKKDSQLMRNISQSDRKGFYDFYHYSIHCNTLLEGKYSYGIINSAVSEQFYSMVESGVAFETLQNWTDLMLESGEIIKFELEV